MREKSLTSDEVAHITGGYTFNHWNDYRLHPENGMLPQRWQALPITLTGVKYPAQSDDAWRKSDVWLTGHRFLYQSGNDHEWMLSSARAMNSVWGAALVLLVFFWSYRLWGICGAIVSAFTCTLCPTMLAHSALATSDMCMAFFFMLALALYWHHLNSNKWLSGVASIIVFGLAATAKHSSLLLLPMVLILALARLAHNTPLHLGRYTFSILRERIGVIILSLFIHALTIVFFIWAFFHFRYSAFNPDLPPGEFTFPWNQMLSFGGAKAQVIEFFRTWHLLPEGYLYGLSFVLKHAEARATFLDGEYGIYGWVRFFPLAFIYKTPISLLAGLAISAGLVAVRLRTTSRAQLEGYAYRVAPLLVLFVIYWAFSLTTHLNIGHRHILPTYPVLYIFCGALGWAGQRAYRNSRTIGLALGFIIAGLLGWHATVAAEIYPHYLAYFSPLAGGPAEGYKHLVDSSLDWGQDLPGLKKWLSSHRKPGEKVFLSYAGNGDPTYYGIEAVHLPMFNGFQQVRPWYWPEPGLYLISASMLQHVFAAHRGPWTPSDERQYQQLRRFDPQFHLLKSAPLGHPELMRDFTPLEWNKNWMLYDQLRFARLCHYLRARQPDAMVGYSILVYRLDQTELTIALDGDLRELVIAIERAPQRAHQPVTNN